MRPAFSVLVLGADGSRVARLRVPRWIARWAAYGALSCVVLSGEYMLLQGHQLGAERARVRDQRKVIDTLHGRVATVRSEIGTWGTLHARMWQALGRDTQASDATSGVAAARPGTPAAVVESGPAKDLDLLASSIAEEGRRLRELEQVVDRTGAFMRALPLRWPLRGPVKSEYGVRQSPWTGKPEQHAGLDIGASPGTPVEAPAEGTVIAANSSEDYGRYVMLDHGNGVRSLYGHLQKVDVKIGERVETGEVIGHSGASGHTTGPHLHYELRVDGKPVDPRRFLWEP
jgi:murein DD-endopeptidase MepM/ murein hydrolase activator NlpD